jgi:hypothetical protein
LLVVGLQTARRCRVDETGQDGVSPAEMLDGFFMHGGSVEKLARSFRRGKPGNVFSSVRSDRKAQISFA